MRKFRFRLERVRKFKQQLEDDKKRELKRCQGQLLAEQKALERLSEMRKRYLATFGVSRTGRVNLGQLLMAKRYIDKLSSDIVLQMGKVKTAESQFAKAREALLEARREKQKYENLKSRLRQRYDLESVRLSMKELDEFAVRNWTKEAPPKTAD